MELIHRHISKSGWTRFRLKNFKNEDSNSFVCIWCYTTLWTSPYAVFGWPDVSVKCQIFLSPKWNTWIFFPGRMYVRFLQLELNFRLSLTSAFYGSMTFTTAYYVFILRDTPSVLSTNVWYDTSTASQTIVTQVNKSWTTVRTIFWRHLVSMCIFKRGQTTHIHNLCISPHFEKWRLYRSLSPS